MITRNLFYDDLFKDVEFKGMNADLYLKNGNYHLEIDLPSFKKEEIKIEIDRGTILIKASKEIKEEEEDKKYIRRERRYQKVERSFYFSDIDEENIKAEFINGTLHLVIPQKQEDSKKQISID